MKTLKITTTDGTQLMYINILTAKEKHDGYGLLCKVAGDGKTDKHCKIEMSVENYTNFSALWGNDSMEATIKRPDWNDALEKINAAEDQQLREKAFEIMTRSGYRTMNAAFFSDLKSLVNYLKTGDTPD